MQKLRFTDSSLQTFVSDTSSKKRFQNVDLVFCWSGFEME